MKKIIFLLLTIGLLTACSENNASEIVDLTTTIEPIDNETEKAKTVEEVLVIMPYGTPTLSAIKMVKEEPTIDENFKVSYEPVESSDVLSTMLINQEADIAIVPTNLAATIYNKDIPYKLAGASVWGNYYVISMEENLSIEDLKGKTIGCFGRDLTPDAIFRYVLEGNGINPEEDLEIEYFPGSSELASNFIAGEIDIVVAPQPVLTNMLAKREGAVTSIDLQEEWSKLTDFDNFPQASLVISENLINNSPDFVEKFLENYNSSVDWVNENPSEAAVFYEEQNIGLSSAILEVAIPNCSLDFVYANESIDAIDSYLEILNNFNPKLLGGKIVDENFYYSK